MFTRVQLQTQFQTSRWNRVQRVQTHKLKLVPHYGCTITFIRFGSCLYKRSNQLAASARPVRALIMLSTRIAPLESSAMQAGYSPDDAQGPCSRTCRVTTDCSGSSILGVMYPIS